MRVYNFGGSGVVGISSRNFTSGGGS